ncbi:MAG TPA: M15 family metallopeptidase [Actinophytocola sp.]|uniref:M15 family metallopeptidase n=1 Tax=Actinophytocola sp. TaxID=1872138 RepID=UPI002DBF308C|nr:M15 family metallopeptidase [Actinophytocola sp.]HEU5470491.1 M15 family metallopeptidase [Actinophytocola sp.]
MSGRPRTLAPAVVLAPAVLLLLLSCAPDPAAPAAPPSSGSSSGPPSSAGPPATTAAAPATPPAPVWQVGATPLPLRPDGFGQVLPTPQVLTNRSLPTVDRLPPPEGDRWAATVRPVPAEVLARSTWRADCPVAAADLRYLTMSFWGFDGRTHTGEMIVNRRVADDVTGVFATLFRNRFPLEEMRVTARPELDARPTGDGNNTTAFVCRPAVNLTRWSAHAYGLAIDVNPFCNPYIRGDLVLPELASSYVDRGNVRPGMILPGDPTVRAFAAIGWTWGGTWTSPKDLQHFSSTGN